jgi:hypothetical protein
VSGSVELMTNWNKSDYENILKRLNLMGNRMTVRKAIERAAKKAATAGMKEIKNGIANEYTLPKGEIGKAVKPYMVGSAGTSMAIGIKISDSPRPLSDFSFSPKKPPKKPKPVTVEVKRGNKETFTQGAFVAQMPSTGKIGVFEREKEKRKSKDIRGNVIESSKEKIHIKHMLGPAITGMFQANEKVHKAAWNTIFEKFEERVFHELDYLLGFKK